MYELSLAELETELAAQLPARTLLRCTCKRRKVVHHAAPVDTGTSASANHGSVANGNSTDQSISNPQVAAVTNSHRTDIDQEGDNSNRNSNNQFGTPLNFMGN